MVGIMIVALMLIAAVSVDASRIFAAKNELQTAADAAALAGAVQLLEDSSTAMDSAQAYARRNRVEQRSVDSVEIEYGVWQPADRNFIAGGDPKDAVRVTTRHAIPLSLARIFGDSTLTLTTSAVAWSSGPIADTDCSKPLAVPYGRLLAILGYPSWADIDLTDADIRRLREMPIPDREVTVSYASPDDTSGYFSYDDDEYFPVDIDSTWARGDPLNHERDSVGGNNFRSYMVGEPTGQCSRSVRPGDEIRSEPGNKSDAIRDGISDLCELKGGAFNGRECRRGDDDDGGRIDIPFKVLFWQEEPDWLNPNRALLRVKMVGSFVFSEMWDFDREPSSRATLFGHFDVARDFGVVDDTAPSTLVRPVLVR
jgi:Flp pilus assembly protein TadG